jgi:hypothetical protein
MTVKELIRKENLKPDKITIYGVDVDGNRNDYEKDYAIDTTLYDGVEVYDYMTLDDGNAIIFLIVLM